jgi:Zn-dependent protease with chaperone function
MNARPDPTLENRLPDEGINSSDEHPLKEFAWLVTAALVTLAVVVVLVGWGARWIAPKIPFRHEVALAERLGLDGSAQGPADAARSSALQAVADRVAQHLNLPPGMAIVVRYEDADIVNAYATIGGRVRVFRGLLEKLPSEDALAALLAHEIGHVKHRHVVANAGRGLALSLMLGMISSDAGAAAAQGVLGQATSLALLSYSREQETECDDDALDAVAAMYGHAGGFTQLFEALRKAEAERARIFGGGVAIERLRSHPLADTRLEHARQRGAANGWQITGTATPLPAALVVAPKKAAP